MDSRPHDPYATPAIPQDLLEFLERTFPDRSPSLDTPDRSIWAQAGRADLIRYLRSEFEQQKEVSLTCVSPD